MPATSFERMSMASLASDVNKNRHEFAVQAVKKHSQSAFGDKNWDFMGTNASIYHIKID